MLINWREIVKNRLRDKLRDTVGPNELEAEVERRFQEMMEMEVPTNEELLAREAQSRGPSHGFGDQPYTGDW